MEMELELKGGWSRSRPGYDAWRNVSRRSLKSEGGTPILTDRMYLF